MDPVFKHLARAFARFRRAETGNTTIILALAFIPLMLVAGTAIDYTKAAMIRGRLTAVADAAALAATTPPMMSQTTSAAKAAVVSDFSAQARMISGFTYVPNSLTVTVNDTVAANATVRNVSIVYAASVPDLFGILEQHPTIDFTVTSKATYSTAPNINFYLMLDRSASMEIPATTAGIAQMQNNTGCALACHETNYKDSEYTVRYPGWGRMDTYTYAENAGITLRIDNVRQAAQSLASTAQSVMAGNNAAYQMAGYSFADGFNQLFSLQPTNSANVPGMQSALAALVPPLMSANGWLASGESYTYPRSSTQYKTATLTQNTNFDDAGTNFNYALQQVNSKMATPGYGTNQIGDTPQGVLFIVTDGVDDVSLYNSSYCSTNKVWSYSNGYGNFYRCQQPVNTAMCSTIKARGIRIAVLYTTYFPVNDNSWYVNTVAPFMPNVASNLQSCASSPNLYYEVSTDGDITAALQQLFLTALATAPHLTN